MPNLFQKIAGLFKRRPEEVICKKDQAGKYSAYTKKDGRLVRVDGPQFDTCQECIDNYGATSCLQ